MIPKRAYFCRGVGTHKEDKNALDAASREAGVGRLNLVKVSSILPPGLEWIDRPTFDAIVSPGEIVHAIESVTISNVPGMKVTSGIARVRPRDESLTGYVTEIEMIPGIQEAVMRQRIETMALQLFADENGARDFVAAEAWVPGVSGYTIGGHEVELDSLTAVGICNLDGDYTAALVLVVLLP
jgi:arginine decarboxylase